MAIDTPGYQDTARSLTERLAALSPEKRALLEQKLAQLEGRQLIPRQPSGESGVLSFAQQRMWFFAQFDPTNIIYNSLRGLRLCGQLDVTALERALNEIIRRHEVLRTNYLTVDGMPLLQVAAERTLSLSVIDVSENDREATVQRHVWEIVAQPFNLANDFLVRARLLRLASDEHILLLVIHHIAFDGWSVSVLNRELVACYAAFAAGDTPQLDDLPIQYADYAAWQRAWFQGERLEEQLAFWRAQLANMTELKLPPSHPRLPVKSYRGATHAVTLPPALLESVKALARTQNVTLFMTMLAAFYTLLYRYSGQDDLVIGTPIAQRPSSEAELLIGFFINTLVLRADLSGTPTFRELLGRVRETALNAYAHQDLPFEQLVEALQPRRDLSRNPLVQVIFNFRNLPPREAESPALRLETLELHDGISRFDLMLAAVETEQGLTCSFEYDTDLFDAEFIARMHADLHAVLEGIVDDPEQTIDRLPLCSDTVRRQAPAVWHGTIKDYPREATLHGLFAEQATNTPDMVALSCLGETITYGELDRRANRLAHYLRALAVGPEHPVGVFMQRSPDMIIALLAILKAGSAYVPLDPTYPRERLFNTISESAMTVLLTQQSLRADVPDGADDVNIICLDQIAEALARQPVDAPAITVTAEHLAYIIFTSGSTGVPKGVAVPHRAVVRLMFDTEFLDVQPDDTFLFFRTLAFDIAGVEIWDSLLHGARLVILPESLPSLDTLGKTIVQEGVTILSIPTALFAPIITHDLAPLRGLRALVVGGEVMPVAAAERAATELSHCRIINAYGPTEAAIYATSYVVPSGTRFSGTVPIGQPIANTTAYVLDAELQPVPIGVIGELYLGGDSLAQGYNRRPELTAELFIPHPCSADPTARLYKTGDLARWLPDGNIEFLGRTDTQVKVHGYRIELGEVESVLSRHPAVRACVVLAREDTPDERRLVAYTALAPDTDCTTETLRAYLGEKLPEYMVPAAFVILPELPLTPVGKVDRKALPAPETPRENQQVSPTTDTERALAAIWCELFHLNTVSATDSFFDLGGHSLLAMQAVARMQKTLGIELTVPVIFIYPTIAGLAAYIDQQETCTTEEARPSDSPTPSRPQYAPATEPRWNAAPAASIHALFAEQVSRTPEAVALTCGEEQVTYDALNRRANQLAHYLRELGVGADTPVGLCLERSTAMMVAILAILKAGGAYVPLEASYPANRLAFMVQNVGMPVLITECDRQAVFADFAPRLLCLDAEADAIAGYPDDNLNDVTMPDTLAYIMFTSGSTGIPKGVAIPHRGVVRLVCGADYLDFRADDVFLQFAPLSFDASTFEIWGALLNGARLVLMPSKLSALSELGPVVRRERVSVLWLTASLFNLLVDSDVTVLRGLRALLTGGEALSVPHVRRARQALPDCRLINGYGPTENTTFTCCYTVPNDFVFADAIPIGYPIAGTTVHVLNEAMQPVTPGEVGELYTGGNGLARGYWKRSKLTDERFVHDPFSAEPNARLYRTGDLVRQLPDGALDFVARADDQVKIRGYRIEPGEIEAVLAEHPTIGQCCVLAREDVPGEKHLVAYVAPRYGMSVIAGAVRVFLKDRLPDYMVPTFIVCLPQFPLTASGKIDRQALPAPERGGQAIAGARDGLEQQLVAIWEEVTGVTPVGIHDDFFALGGHSLLAIRLFTMIEQRLGQKLPLSTLFQAATVAEVAEVIRRTGWITPWQSLIPIQPRGTRRPLYAVHPAGGGVFVYRMLSNLLGPEQPFYGLQENRDPNGDGGGITVEAIAADYIRQLRAFQPDGPYLLSGFSFGGIVVYEMARQLQAQGAQVGALILFDTFCPHHGHEPSAPQRVREYLAERRRQHPLQFLGSCLATLRRNGERACITALYHACRLLGRPFPVRYRTAGGFKFYKLASVRYHPQPYTGDLLLFRATGTPELPAPAGDLGWSEVVSGTIDILTIPGQHDEMFTAGHVERLAEQLRMYLARIQEVDYER